MAATDIRLQSVIVPATQSGSFRYESVHHGLGYRLNLGTQTFGTLSSNNPTNSRQIEGLLYVPVLSEDNTANCTLALDAIPENAVNLTSLPSGQNYPLIAMFPWTTSTACTEAYIIQARMDAAQGAFVFQPGTGDILTSSMSWRLSGERANYIIRWNPFPIYAIAAASAQSMLRESALYSGNMSQVPNGSELVQTYNPDDYARLFATVQIHDTGRIPFMWVTIIITLSVLLALCIVAAIVAHFLRRHQRSTLRRRLERGEVDLQTLGIKKMNVPQSKIDEMPKYVYIDAKRSNSPNSTSADSSTLPQQSSFSQSTCPVCLDDFEPGQTQVRELPCRHIFHPECIDIFLRDRSSLCPLCKSSALPKGYCPDITDIMVRRERLARRVRQAELRNASNGSATGADNPENDVELARPTSTNATTTPDGITPSAMTAPIPQAIAAQGHEARADWRRDQLARQQEEQYSREAEVTRQADVGRPLWRRVVGRVFPGVD